MIAQITGKVLEKTPPQVVVDVQGIGYEVEAPISTLFSIGEAGAEVTLFTQQIIRDDAHLLFGFATRAEKALFRELIRINGVGPKLALAILSGCSVDEFWGIVRDDDVTRLTRLPGVGKKTAERLIVEMRDREAGMDVVARLPEKSGVAVTVSPSAEAVAALEALGYKPQEAKKMVDMAAKSVDGESGGSQELIRLALRQTVRK